MSRKKSKAFGAKVKKVEKTKKTNPFDSIFKRNSNFTSNKNKDVSNIKPRRGTDIRRQTLAVEFNNLNKVNKIVDKRVAERDFNLTAQEKAEKRFVLQRKKLFASKNMFNLSDDEGGNDDSEDENENSIFNRKNLKIKPKTDDDVGGELDSDLVALANFGGGSFNAQLRERNLIKTDKPSRKEIMENLIQIRRQNKEQRQQEKDDQEDNTDKLNDLFMNLQKSGDLLTTKKALSKKAEMKKVDENLDGYDSLYHELQFDPRQKTAKPEPLPSKPKKGGIEASKPVKQIDSEIDKAPQGTLKMLEPRFLENYQPGSKAGKSSAKNKLKLMRQKLKKETRGAVKELRKDARFMAKMQNERDQVVRRERIEKTKNIMANLQVQESEYKKRTLKKF